jgi:hypothetical protein
MQTYSKLLIGKDMKISNKSRIFGLILFMTTCTAFSQNKCTLSDGLVVMLNRSCPANGTVGEDMARREYEFKARDDERIKQNQANLDSIKAVNKKCAPSGFVDEPVIGITEHRFRNCTFVAEHISKINVTQTANTISRQYVIKDNFGIKYVYTRNGMVTSIQR